METSTGTPWASFCCLADGVRRQENGSRTTTDNLQPCFGLRQPEVGRQQLAEPGVRFLIDILILFYILFNSARILISFFYLCDIPSGKTFRTKEVGLKCYEMLMGGGGIK